jgi:hypothetical protein
MSLNSQVSFRNILGKCTGWYGNSRACATNMKGTQFVINFIDDAIQIHSLLKVWTAVEFLWDQYFAIFTKGNDLKIWFYCTFYSLTLECSSIQKHSIPKNCNLTRLKNKDG